MYANPHIAIGQFFTKNKPLNITDIKFCELYDLELS